VARETKEFRRVYPHKHVSLDEPRYRLGSKTYLESFAIIGQYDKLHYKFHFFGVKVSQ
jgi:hypothetical protein